MSKGEVGILRRIWLYSLIAFASLALVGVLAVGVVSALNGGQESRVAQVDAPTVADPPAPAAVSEKTQEEKKAAEQEKKAAEQEQNWREIAEQRKVEERSAAERRAAEEQVAEEAQPTIPTNTALSLNVPSAGIQNDPVTDSVEESVLANGAGKIPSTGFPWQPGANTYIAAHVYGYPGTGSWQQFARVPNMVMGDQIFLTDSNGTTYEYQVSEIFTVAPTDVWVVEPTGQSMVSLQTCVGPNWSERLVVRGTLVGTSQA
ncbi:MAG: sortase [Rubrobacteraceae bacterium]